jgi:hypothetical protein
LDELTRQTIKTNKKLIKRNRLNDLIIDDDC